MSKFCGNCGAQLDDAAKVCGNCGTPLENNRSSSSSIPGIDYVDPEERIRRKKRNKRYVALAVVVIIAIITANIASGFIGYKGVVRKIMKAYEDYDLNAIVSMSSEFYYAIEDENYVDDYFRDAITSGLDDFEGHVGHKYKLTYEVTDSYELSKRKYEDLLDVLSINNKFDTDVISKVKVVEIDVTATEGRQSLTIDLRLTLTKEDGSWKLLYLQ